MGKRSNFKRRASDFYATPKAAAEPLLRRLRPQRVAEPCAGDGALCRAMTDHGFTIAAAYDLKPRAKGIVKRDALSLTLADLNGAKLIVTNPPWPHRGQNGGPTVPILQHLSTLRPTWALLNADFMHTLYAGQLRCVRIVAIGRVRWIEGTDQDGKENSCWYLFDVAHSGSTEFIGR